MRWAQLLSTSFNHWTKRDLIASVGSAEQQAAALFTAGFAVVSHGTGSDPFLNYGNRVALNLWEVTWEEFRRMPSRLTAEPVNQVERTRMLVQAEANGYIDDYRGIRISTTGRRFLVERAVVWNVIDQSGRVCGQAATFSQWTFL